MWPFDKLKQPRTRAAESSGGNTPRLWPSSLWRPRGDHSLEGSEAIFAAVTMLSNTVASMELKLMKGNEEAKDHYLSRLIQYQPTPRMNPYTWRQTMETCRDTAGNCYALKVRGDGGEIIALDILDPDRVTPERNLDTGEIWYQVRPDDGGLWVISGREMIHCRHVSTGGARGVSPIDVLRDTLDYDDQMQTFSVEQVKGINGAVVLEFPSDIGDARKKEIIDNFMENYRRSSGSLIVLSGGVKNSTISKSPVDAKVLDVDRITTNKVARVYNLPPSLLGDYSSSSYTSQEQQQLEFIERTVTPIARMYEAELTQKLLTWDEVRQGYHFRFDIAGLLSADLQARGTYYQQQIRSAMITPNEGRALENRPPLPGGDRLLVSKDLTDLEWLMQHPTEGGNT